MSNSVINSVIDKFYVTNSVIVKLSLSYFPYRSCLIWWLLRLPMSIFYVSCCCPLVAPMMQNNGQQRLGWTIYLFKRELLHEWTILYLDNSGMEYKTVPFDDELSLSIVCFSVAVKSCCCLFPWSLDTTEHFWSTCFRRLSRFMSTILAGASGQRPPVIPRLEPTITHLYILRDTVFWQTHPHFSLSLNFFGNKSKSQQLKSHTPVKCWPLCIMCLCDFIYGLHSFSNLLHLLNKFTLKIGQGI